MKVILVTPSDVDAKAALDLLRLDGISAHRVASLRDLSFAQDEIGCIIVVEEALTTSDMPAFQQAIASQPTWSDLPLLLLAGHDTPLVGLAERLFPHSGNVAVLQRPLHPVALVSAVNVALRARGRQLQVRDLLEQRAVALRRRDEFMAMLAHELRNPLAPIHNAVHMMGRPGVDGATVEKSRRMIEKQARHITRLVDDLLDVSRLELGKFELRVQATDLNHCVAAAVEACTAFAASHGHTVTLHPATEPLPIRGDPVRIEQVFGNLLVNAAKFTPAHGRIEVRAFREADSAVVWVQDNGVGIRAESLASMFDLFVQEESSLARTPGGLGIGLTLVKRLVEIHGGTVALHSEGVDHGTRVIVRLPLSQQADSPARAVQNDAVNGPGKRVLVIEDNADIRDSLSMLLKAWQHDVEFATNGVDGVARAVQWQPDVALIDIGLPGIDGYEVARKIRATETLSLRGIRLIAMTGYGQSSDREKALRAGFDSHVVKPVDPLDLQRMLAEAS